MFRDQPRDVLDGERVREVEAFVQLRGLGDLRTYLLSATQRDTDVCVCVCGARAMAFVFSCSGVRMFALVPTTLKLVVQETRTHTYIHTCIHTYIHTYICMHMVTFMRDLYDASVAITELTLLDIVGATAHAAAGQVLPIEVQPPLACCCCRGLVVHQPAHGIHGDGLRRVRNRRQLVRKK